MTTIRSVDIETADMAQFLAKLADCVILTSAGKFLMQKRPNVGGEPKEELGAVVEKDDLRFIGAVTEDFTNHTQIIHIYFWQDRENTITGCYEFEAVEFDTIESLLQHSDVMDYARWAVRECQSNGVL